MRDQFDDCMLAEYTGGGPHWLDGQCGHNDVAEEDQEAFWDEVVAMSEAYAAS